MGRKKIPNTFLCGKKTTLFYLEYYYKVQNQTSMVCKLSRELFQEQFLPRKSDMFNDLNSPFTTAVPSQNGAGFETKANTKCHSHCMYIVLKFSSISMTFMAFCQIISQLIDHKFIKSWLAAARVGCVYLYTKTMNFSLKIIFNDNLYDNYTVIKVKRKISMA